MTGVDHVVRSILGNTGQPVAKRAHGPITVTKEVDVSTPQLHLAWAHNDPFTTWRLDFHAADSTGPDVSYYVIELSGARVSRIQLMMPNTLIAANVGVSVHETVSFVYDKIMWSWLPGKVEAEDVWSVEQ